MATLPLPPFSQSCTKSGLPQWLHTTLNFNLLKKKSSGSTKQLYYRRNPPKSCQICSGPRFMKMIHICKILKLSVLCTRISAVVKVTAFQCTWMFSVSIGYCCHFFFFLRCVLPVKLQHVDPYFHLGFSFDIVLGFPFTSKY